MKTVLVDANVIIDIATNDSKWAPWSASAIGQRAASHRFVYNPIIYAETLPSFGSAEEIREFFRSSPLKRIALPFTAAAPASRAFLAYKQRGGTKSAPLPDFFIGAHAEAENLTILTRDPTRYRTYFPQVQLITPPS